MRVKRYVVDSLPDALTMIRRELGQDAVILNTKQLRTGGFLGLFGKKKIEVIAAVDGGAARDGGTPVRKAAPQSVSAAAAAAIPAASSERESNRPHVGSRAAARAYRSLNQAMTAAAETKDADRSYRVRCPPAGHSRRSPCTNRQPEPAGEVAVSVESRIGTNDRRSSC